MKKIFILGVFFTFGLVCAVWAAVESNKPATHTSTWVQAHGNAAKANQAECLSCHEERLECISCHEDTPPRDHGTAWVQKNHGLESRWDRNRCQTCHKEDFCVSCHEVSVPRSHNKAGFGTLGNPSFHCQTGCQLPSGSWRNTPAKNCIVCHQTRPILQTGQPHQMN